MSKNRVLIGLQFVYILQYHIKYYTVCMTNHVSIRQQCVYILRYNIIYYNVCMINSVSIGQYCVYMLRYNIIYYAICITNRFSIQQTAEVISVGMIRSKFIISSCLYICPIGIDSRITLQQCRMLCTYNHYNIEYTVYMCTFILQNALYLFLTATGTTVKTTKR